VNAKEYLSDMLSSVSPDDKPQAWRWLNSLCMAVNENATVNENQLALLSTLCGEVDCQMRKYAGRLAIDVFAIAAWINTCSDQKRADL